MRSLLHVFLYLMMIIFLPFGSAETCDAKLVPCPMPVYINGEPAAEEGEWIFTAPDGRYWADVGFLRRHIAPDFISSPEDGVWMVRRAPLGDGAVTVIGERAFLDLEMADFCLRIDPYWLETGVFSLLTRFSPVLEADGGRYERTGETAPRPDDGWDAVSPEGRAMWRIGADWWLEDDAGNIWRYAPAEGEGEDERVPEPAGDPPA